MHVNHFGDGGSENKYITWGGEEKAILAVFL